MGELYKLFNMMHKVFLATLVIISLAYLSDAVYFKDRFPGKTLADLADCKEGHSLTGIVEVKQTTKFKPKSGNQCAKYCLKQRLAGQRKDNDNKHIVGSQYLANMCFCGRFLKDENTPASLVIMNRVFSCTFKPAEKEEEKEEENEEDDNNDVVELIPGKTCWKEGEQFMGTTVSTTASGKTCDTWHFHTIAWHMYDDEGDYDKSMYDAVSDDIQDETAGNYCRNYNENPNGPYCFVGATKVDYNFTFEEIYDNGNILSSQDHFEHCDIPKCP